MILNCTRILKGNISSMSERDIVESIKSIRGWIKSGNYRYDMKLLLNRLRDLEEIIEFENINVNM